jgi:hypothetical protein
MPEKHMNAMAMRPVRIMDIPTPLRPSGMF